MGAPERGEGAHAVGRDRLLPRRLALGLGQVAGDELAFERAIELRGGEAVDRDDLVIDRDREAHDLAALLARRELLHDRGGSHGVAAGAELLRRMAVGVAARGQAARAS